MESRVTALKNNFNNISVIRNNVRDIFDFLQLRINKLKFFYSEFIKNNKTELFIFGLDSFHFQSRLIDIEYEGMYKIFRSINNRMYCEYFKLYKIIVSYIKDTINDKKLLEFIKVNNFPIYKDLEPEKEYKFEIIIEIHEHILILITSIIGNLTSKENEYKLYVDKNQIGLNIDNFVNTYSFDVIMMREKLKLFLTYIEFFHKLHTKYLQRFSNKIQLMNTHINDDIKFDETVKINKPVNLTDTKGLDNSSFLLSPRMSNSSQKNPSPPGFLKKGMDSMNSLFSVSKNFENQNQIVNQSVNVKQNVNLFMNDEKTLETETLNHQNIESAFSNIDIICNNVINNSNEKTETDFDKFFENPTNNIETNESNIEENIEENIEANNVDNFIEEVKNDILSEQNQNEEQQNDDPHNDDVSVLSLDSTFCDKNVEPEEDDKNKKEELSKEDKQEPKKKRVYKPRKKN
jgi:hypothetical protein